MSERAIVRSEDVWKTFQNNGIGFDALKGVSIEIEKGEFACIMGPSGCGKSTLLHLLGCLDSATRGDVVFEGRNVSGMDEGERCGVRLSGVGFVFQSFNLLPTLTVLENVEMPARLAGSPGVKRREEARALLSRVGLQDKCLSLPHKLSGGERQRAAVARALINNPRLILADEPTGNLDSVSGSHVMELLGKLNAEGQTIVMVTHNPETTRHSTRIIHMKDGMIER